MTALQEASTKALDALRKAMQGNLDFDVALEAFEALRAALAQQDESAQVQYLKSELAHALAQYREQQPVCHGCGIPAGDVHMSTCKSGKWPSRVSNGDTAAPAPQVQEPTAWRTEALKWIRRKAEDQRATNEQNPRHAEAYPSWGERVRHWHWLADELELEQNSTSFGLDPYQEPAPQPAQGEPTGCACRWDADDNRVATCARHQGWLDVVHEWAERAKAAEAALQSAQPKQEPLTDEAIYSIVLSEFKCVPLPYDIRLTRAIEASHGINGRVEAATRPAIDAASKQGGQHD